MTIISYNNYLIITCTNVLILLTLVRIIHDMSNTYLQLIYMYEHLILLIRPKNNIVQKKRFFLNFVSIKKNPIIFTLLFNSNKVNEKSTQSTV